MENLGWGERGVFVCKGGMGCGLVWFWDSGEVYLECGWEVIFMGCRSGGWVLFLLFFGSLGM